MRLRKGGERRNAWIGRWEWVKLEEIEEFQLWDRSKLRRIRENRQGKIINRKMGVIEE